MLQEWLKNRHNISFNDQQNKVMEHCDGAALVLAVAGAGKTTCLCARTAKLIFDGKADAGRICTLTFSKAASRDMKHRFNQLFHGLVPNAHEVHFSTIHSFCYKILRHHYRKHNIPFQFIEKGKAKIDKNTLLRKIYAHYCQEYMDTDTLEELERLIGFSKNRLLTIEEIENVDTGIKKFPVIFQAYEQYKNKHYLLDFDDMLTKTYHLLKENQLYLNIFRNQYDYWQVDEFQDTSPVQWEIIKMMVGYEGNVLCVGDDDQTIYSFRGSTPATMLGFKDDFPISKAYFMEENFRCGKLSTNISSQFIQKNRNRYNKQIFTKNPEREMNELILYSDEREQLDKTIDSIMTIMENKTDATIGVLFRKNLSSIPFIDALSDLKIPFKVRDHIIKSMRHWIINDMLNIIDFAYHPHNKDLLEKIYYRMNGYISREQLAYSLKIKKPDQHLLKVLAKNPALEDYQVDRLNQLIDELERLKSKKGPSILKQILYSIGYMSFLERNHSISQSAAKHLISVLEHMMRNAESPQEWRHKLEEMENKINMAQQAKNAQLTLTTIHSAKGLEYDYVFIVDVTENIFPSLKAGKKVSEENILEQIEEERRLMYVAMTRGINKVTVSAPKIMMNQHQFNSMFVEELQTLLPTNNKVSRRFMDPFRKQKSSNHSLSAALNPGVMVDHIKFGKGAVASKDHACVMVNFGNQIKKISLDYAGKVLKIDDAES